MTQMYGPVRIPDDLKEAADEMAARLHLNFSGIFRAALAAYLAGDTGTAAREQAARIAELQDQVAALRADLARCREERAASTGSDAAFAAVLQAATFEDPVTTARLAAESGYTQRTAARKLKVLVARGDAAAADWAEYYAVPGSDIRQALRDIRWVMETRTRPGAGTPAPAHVVPVAATGAPRKARIAATKEEPPAVRTEPPGAVAAELRDTLAAKGADVRLGSELPAHSPGTAVFKPAGADAPVLPVHDVGEAGPGKPRGRRGTRCTHRLPAGAWCKTCGQPK